MLERGDIASYRADLDRTYRDAHPTMKALLAMMDLERRWVISDRDPIRHWSKGRVTLLGDAAHPTLQSLAQGACMAIEDAVCLAETDRASRRRLRRRRSARYENARYLRTARVQFESRYLWDNFYHVGGIEREVMRDDLVRRAARTTCSTASPGSMTASRFREAAGEGGMSKHVAVLMGGWSAEREVVAALRQGLRRRGRARRLPRHAASMSAATSPPC